jgi:hypothetical protein
MRAGFVSAPKDIPLEKPADDPYRTKGDWKDAAILPPPADWGGGLPGGKLPAMTSQIDPATGAPLQWPIRYTPRFMIDQSILRC